MASKPKFYVTMVMDCPDCDGTGNASGWPDGVNCDGCNGAGAIEGPVELAEALATIGILLRLEDIERTAKRAAYYSDAMANGGI
jgi:hypothetical protein